MLDNDVDQQSDTLAENITDGSLSAARQVLQAMHPAEIADALESLPPSRRRVLWDLVDTDVEGEVLMEVGDEVRESLVRDMDVEELCLLYTSDRCRRSTLCRSRWSPYH